MSVTLKWKKLDPEAIIPKYMSEKASGMDIRACLSDESRYPDFLVNMMPGDVIAIPTGLAVEIPEGYEIQIRPRSGLSMSTSLRIPNSPGTIDADYRGEIKVLMEHTGSLIEDNIEIRHGDRIAQIVVAPVTRVQNECVEDLSVTSRGSGGFGSTGV